MILAVIAVITVAIAASVASANKPANGCSTNYILTPVDPNNLVMVHQDHNGDQQVCAGVTKRGYGAGSSTNIVDNSSNSQRLRSFSMGGASAAPNTPPAE